MAIDLPYYQLTNVPPSDGNMYVYLKIDAEVFPDFESGLVALVKNYMDTYPGTTPSVRKKFTQTETTL